jgi:hypothetical protein
MIPRVRRVIGSALTLVVAPLLASACAATSVAATPVTHAQAIAFARAVNLRAADMPGWRVAPGPEPQPATDSPPTVLGRCSRTRRFRYIASLPSTTFLQGDAKAGAQVVSTVGVAPSASLAAGEFAAVASARVRSCVERVSRAPRSEDLKVSSKRFAWSSLPLPAAAHGFKLRVTGRLGQSEAGARGTRAYFDLLAFARGPAQVYLFAVFWGSLPQSTTERNLISLLHSRATAQRL